MVLLFIFRIIGYKNRYVKVFRGYIWVEGDYYGYSFDSNFFGSVSYFVVDIIRF